MRLGHILLLAGIVLTSLTSTSLAQVQSHPLSQVSGPMDVSLNILLLGLVLAGLLIIKNSFIDAGRGSFRETLLNPQRHGVSTRLSGERVYRIPPSQRSLPIALNINRWNINKHGVLSVGFLNPRFLFFSILLPALLTFTLFSSPALAQTQSHPLSQVSGPMDVNLLLLFVPLVTLFGDKIKKVLIDLDVLTIAESERRDERKEKAISFFHDLEKQKAEVLTPTFILKQLKVWKNTDLVTKIVSRLFKLPGELVDPDDVDEALVEKTGKRLKEFAEFGAKEIGTKASDFILILYASVKEVDHVVTFNKKHLKSKEKEIGEFLRKYNLHVPKIILPNENSSIDSSSSFKLPLQILPSKFFNPFSNFLGVFSSHITNMCSEIFKVSKILLSSNSFQPSQSFVKPLPGTLLQFFSNLFSGYSFFVRHTNQLLISVFRNIKPILLLLPTIISLTLFSSIALAQVQSHPLSQVSGPMDVNLNLTGMNITNVSYVFFGNNSVDTYLYRSGTNTLQTASHLIVAGGWVNSTGLNVSGTTNVSINSPTFFIDTTNSRVGIGTTSPGSKLTIADDLLAGFGTDSDTVILSRSTELAADTALTGVLLGTTTGSRLTINANSLIISDITASGGIGLYVNFGGVSYQSLLALGPSLYLGPSVPGGYENTVKIEHLDTTNAASHAALVVKANHVSADAYMSVQTAATQWYMGVDNSDSDSLKIGTGTAVGTNTFLTALTGGNVGIGTTAPGNYKLNVIGDINASWVNGTNLNASNQLCLGGVCNTVWPSSTNNMTGYGTAGYIPQWENTTALNNSNIFQLGSNVGIGTTTPTHKLNVIGTFNFTNSNNAFTWDGFGDLNFQNSGSQPSQKITSYRGSSGGVVFTLRHARGTVSSPAVVQSEDVLGLFNSQGYSANAGAFRTATEIYFTVDGEPDTGGSTTDMPGRIEFRTSLDGSSSPATRMTIKNNGNVGIGTIVPGQTLAVVGTANITGGSATTQGLFVDSNGRTGLGTSSPGNYKLNVIGDINASWANVTNLNVSNTFNAANFVASSGWGNFSNLNVTNNAYIGSNVGIGTASLGATLHVVEGSTQVALMLQSDTGSDTDIYIRNGGNNVWGIYNDASGAGSTNALIFRDLQTPADRVTILKEGNVGIGTTSPGNYKLNVIGDVNASWGNFSNLNVTNNAYTTNLQAYNWVNSSALNISGTNNISMDSPTFFIDATNNRVGIGTTAPTNALTISGDTEIKDGFGLVIGNSAQIVGYSGITSELQVLGTSSNNEDGSMTLGIWRNSVTPPVLQFVKSRGSTIGSNAIVANNDWLGVIAFAADDGTDFRTEGALIRGEVDGTPGVDDMPGRLTFHTTTDGANSATERMRIDSAGNVGIGTTAPTTRLYVNNNATINGTSGSLLSISTDGSLGGWTNQTTNLLPATRSIHSSVAANGYVYVIGGVSASTVYYAKLNADGSTGAWSTNANALPVTTYGHSSVAANGYVYVIGGATVSTVYYAKLNSDGSTGAWSTNANNLPAARYYTSSVAANGYVYVIGGSDGVINSTVYYAKLNADGSTGAWTNSTNLLPTASFRHTSVAANGYVYVIGGDLSAARATVYYAKLNSDGSTGAWVNQTSNTLPAARNWHSSVAANGYVYVIGGGSTSGGTPQSTVYYAKLNSDGSTGAWSTNANALPAVRDAHSSVAANGYVYVIGGRNAAGSDQSTVYYASTARVLLGANLDLLGLTSGGLSGNDTGQEGGSIYAGNLFLKDSLEVGGQSQLWNGLSVNGLLSVKSYSSNTTINSSSPVFHILNGSNTTFLTVLSSGNVGIGTASPLASLQISGGYNTTPAFTNTAQLRITGTGAGGTGNDAVIRFDTPSNSRLIYVDENDTNKLKFTGGGGTDLVTIDNSGNVGIGTTSPGNYKLNVIGDINASWGNFTNINITNTFNAANFAASSGWGNFSNLNVTNNAYIGGNVGIGTTSPVTKLAVIKDSDVSNGIVESEPALILGSSATGNYQSLRLFVDSTNSVSGIQSAQTNVASRALLLNPDGGNVGIGTATPNYLLEIANSSTALNVSGTLFVNGTTGRVGIGTASPRTELDVSSSGDTKQYIQSTAGGLSNADFGLEQLSTGNALVWEYGNYNLSFGTNNTERITITNAGNVGIGTTGPVKKLDVSGDIRADGRYYIRRPSDDYSLSFASRWDGTTGNPLTGTVGINMAFGSEEASSQIIFAPGNVEKVRIDNNGNVGIGTTNPQSLLHVSGTGSTLNVSNSTASHLYVSGTTGRVGIGTASPEYKLDVQGTLDAAAILRVSQSGDVDEGLYFQVNAASNDIVSIDSATGKLLNIRQTGSTTGISLSTTGNVGIGTTSPLSKLHIENATGPLLNVTNGTNSRLFIDSTGNVGIGTPSPGTKLDVRGIISTQFEAINSVIELNSLADALKYFDISADTLGGAAILYQGTEVRGKGGSGYGSGFFFQLGKNATILPKGWSGTVSAQGVGGSNWGTSVLLQTSPNGTTWTTESQTTGSTNSNWQELSYTAASIGAPLYVRFYLSDGSGTGGSGAYLKLRNVAVTNLPVIPAENPLTGVIATNYGNVGIGTTAPQQKLDVVGNINTTGLINASGAGNNYFGGNVGIGTASPANKLDVEGNISFGHTGTGMTTTVQATLAPTTGTVDLATPHTGGGGVNGILIVYNSLTGDALQRTETLYYVHGRGTSLTFTSLSTANGPNGGSTFTLTAPSNGVIRMTNTQGNEVQSNMLWIGTGGG